jgi:hypothetical protein
MSLRLLEKTAEKTRSPGAMGRAQALLGETPTLTLVADPASPDACCMARFVRHGDVWLGVVSDRAAFTDRVRMGFTPRFLFGDASVVTVSGTAHAKILGRVAAVSPDVAAAIAGVVGPWGAGDGVVVAISPEEIVVDTDVSPAVLPRT